MASKVKSAVMLLGLAGLIVLCHMAGMKLESRMKEETRETFNYRMRCRLSWMQDMEGLMSVKPE